MLNQQKRKQVFLPKLEHFFPERPLLLSFKQNHAIQHNKNGKIVKIDDCSPKRQGIHNSYFLNKSPLYEPLSDKKNQRQQERYGSKSARESLALTVNKQNNDDIFVKRGKLYTINRKSLHIRKAEQSYRVYEESPHKLKFKGIKLQKIGEEKKMTVYQELSGWNNAQQDSYLKIIENI